jgi:CheY-like chemotaxis protein
MLVAEDTPFNQKFILRLIERWGHDARLVPDGRQAVEAFSRERFDVVLMDVQMPEMDGLESTRAIRAHESRTGARTPIIAMTAHAIKGDRERCLSAGMDDYVSKPIDPDTLMRLIQKHVGAGPPPAPAVAAPGTAARPPSLLKAFGQDWGFFKEIVETFISDFPNQLETLRRAMRDRDPATFRRAAHSLKGMLRNFESEPAAQKAARLEKMAAEEELAGASPLVEEVAEALKQVESQLLQIIRDGPPR